MKKITMIKRRLSKYLRSWILVINSLFAAAFPFAEQIIASVQANMPQLAEYLPPNVFKWVGIAVVLLNIWLGARQVKAAAAKEGAA